MNSKIFAISCLLAVAGATPEADPALGFHHGLGLAHHAPIAPVAYHAGPAANCKTENDILITQNCVPSTENICNTIMVDTEEIEYVKVCKETTDHLCDAPIAHAAHHVYKREADADADAEAFHGFGFARAHAAHGFAHGHVAHHVAPVPVVAHAVGHSIESTVTHACRDVTTEHCVDNPTVKVVPVEVEHCHVITKVTCTDVENLIPVTTCEAVTTTHVSEAAYVAPVVHHVAPAVHHAPLAAHHYAPLVHHAAAVAPVVAAAAAPAAAAPVVAHAHAGYSALEY